MYAVSVNSQLSPRRKRGFCGPIESFQSGHSAVVTPAMGQRWPQPSYACRNQTRFYLCHWPVQRFSGEPQQRRRFKVQSFRFQVHSKGAHAKAQRRKERGCPDSRIPAPESRRCVSASWRETPAVASARLPNWQSPAWGISPGRPAAAATTYCAFYNISLRL